MTQGTPFYIDYLLPLAVYPMNDLWNLVPAEPEFNQHTKRDRIRSLECLQVAEPHLAQTYALYASTPLLRKALISDTEQRFRSLLPTDKASRSRWQAQPFTWSTAWESIAIWHAFNCIKRFSTAHSHAQARGCGVRAL